MPHPSLLFLILVIFPWVHSIHRINHAGKSPGHVALLIMFSVLMNVVLFIKFPYDAYSAPEQILWFLLGGNCILLLLSWIFWGLTFRYDRNKKKHPAENKPE